MSLTINEVEHVAHLARLRLLPEELEQLRTELSRILGYIDMLKEVDVTDIAPTVSGHRRCQRRAGRTRCARRCRARMSWPTRPTSRTACSG